MAVQKRRLEVKTMLIPFSPKHGIGETIEYSGVLLNLNVGSTFDDEIARKSYVIKDAPRYSLLNKSDVDILSVEYTLNYEE